MMSQGHLKTIFYNQIVLNVCLIFQLLFLSGCGAQGPVGTTRLPTMTSLSISSTNTSFSVGTNLQFTAYGNYEDSSAQNITQKVTWVSSMPTIIQISNEGVATALAAGTAQISANINDLSSSNTMTLTVTNNTPKLSLLSLTPSAPNPLGIGSTQQFTLTATYTDTSTANVSTGVTWASSSTASATINGTGLATGVAVGTTTISATWEGVSASVALTIRPLFAYISNGTPSTILTCPVSTNPGSVGALAGCSSTGSGLSIPFQSVFNGAYFYIANQLGNNITTCKTNFYGNLTGCQNSTSSITNANAVAIYGSYLYVSSYSGNTISSCFINSNGSLETCNVVLNSGLVTPRGVATSGSYLYVAMSQILRCTMNLNGTLTSCGTTGGTLHSPISMAISGNYAYVLNFSNNTVSLCSGALTGSLTCSGTTGSGFNNPIGISIANGYAYIVNYGGYTITYCAIDSNTGALSGCASTGSYSGGFNVIQGISIY